MWGWIKAFTTVSFVFAGVFKTLLDRGPDLTVLLACVVAVFCVAQLLLNQLFIRREVFSVLAFLALLAIPLLWTDFTPYASEKAARFYTLSLLAFIAPLVLVTTTEEIRKFLSVLAVMAVGGSILALSIAPAMDTVNPLQPLEGEHIGFSRLAGMGAVIVLIGVMQRDRRWWWLLTLGPLLYAPIAAGSRGPTVAVFVTVFLVSLFAVSRMSRSRRVLRRVVVVAVLVGFAVVSFGRAPEMARDRFGLLAASQRGYSVNIRQSVYPEAIDLAKDSPLGTGWGSYDSQSRLPLMTYPHNIVLEILLELGWIMAVVTVVCFLRVVRRARRRGASVLLGLVIFGAFNALLSGDLNANRPMYMVIGLALCVPRPDVRHAGRTDTSSH